LNQEVQNILTLIECTLLEAEKPDYIEVSWQMDTIYVLLSKEEYRNIKVYERIQSVYALIQFEHSELLEEYSVLVECLDSDELKGLFELYGKT
jgi:hypothetical protein